MIGSYYCWARRASWIAVVACSTTRHSSSAFSASSWIRLAAVRPTLSTLYGSASSMATTTTTTSGVVEETTLSLTCSDGLVLHGRQWGSSSNDKNAPLMLMLHGWLDNSNSFSVLAPYLVKQEQQQEYSRIVAIDMPGHGRSSHKSVDGPSMVLADYVFYVAEAVRLLTDDDEEKKKQKIVLVGHSMGASVALLYAAAFCDQIASIVLLEGGLPSVKDAQDTPYHIRNHVLTRQRGNAKQVHAVQSSYPSLQAAVQVRQATARKFPGNQWISSEAAQTLVEGASLVKEDDKSLTFLHDQRLKWPSIQYMSMDQWTLGIYPQLTSKPILILLAEHGWPFDPAGFAKAVEILQPTQQATLPGSHHFHLDPETAPAVAQAVADFLFHQQDKEK